MPMHRRVAVTPWWMLWAEEVGDVLARLEHTVAQRAPCLAADDLSHAVIIPPAESDEGHVNWLESIERSRARKRRLATPFCSPTTRPRPALPASNAVVDPAVDGAMHRERRLDKLVVVTAVPRKPLHLNVRPRPLERNEERHLGAAASELLGRRGVSRRLQVVLGLVPVPALAGLELPDAVASRTSTRGCRPCDRRVSSDHRRD